MYKSGKIYKICNDVDYDKIYIGSTCNKLNTKLAQHKEMAKKHPNQTVYK